MASGSTSNVNSSLSVVIFNAIEEAETIFVPKHLIVQLKSNLMIGEFL